MCDEELIGKVFKENEMVIDLQKYKNFYIGERKSEKEIEEILKNEITSINAVGEKATKLLIKNCLGSEKDIKKVCGIPIIQIFFLK